MSGTGFFPRASLAVVATLVLAVPPSAGNPDIKVDPVGYLAELRRLAARKPFLTDSPDVYFEPQSLNRFFTFDIYKKLRGNAYFGYEYDEGFCLQGDKVEIERVEDLTVGRSCQSALRLALEQSLRTAGLVLKPNAPHQVGVCIVGVEPSETSKTLPGLMVEAYLRNRLSRKSFFFRYGAGHRRGLPAAIRLSAEMLVSQLASRSDVHETPQR